MMAKLADWFLNGRGGDAWWDYNGTISEQRAAENPVVGAIAKFHPTPGRILEVGCAGGALLEVLAKRFGSECVGIEPSQQAIRHAQTVRPAISIRCGVAGEMPWLDDASMDVVIYGGCLLWVDRSDLMAVVAATDRILSNQGLLCILDMMPPEPRAVHYVSPGRRKDYHYWLMDYAQLWLANPAYSELDRQIYRIGSSNPSSLVVLRKDEDAAYAPFPYLYDPPKKEKVA